MGAVWYVPSGKGDGVANGVGEAVAVGRLEAVAAAAAAAALGAKALGAKALGEALPPLQAVVRRAATVTAIVIDFMRGPFRYF